MKNTSIYNILFEAEGEKENRDAPEDPLSVKEPNVKARPSTDSVDDQIDSLLLRYENSSIREESGPTTLGESLGKLNLNFLLEQDDEFEEEDEFGDEEAAGGDEGGEEGDDELADPGGSEDMTVTEPAGDQKMPPLDVDAFTNRVVRLLMNHKNLLNIEEAIVNRAKNFLDENYGDQFVNKYLDILEQEHGISTSEFENVKYSEDDDFAIGANPAGSGITGGGA